MTNVRAHALQDADASGLGSLLTAAEAFRKEATIRLDPRRRAQMGQFLTPGPIATFMASMFHSDKTKIRILDPGAGTGSLCASLVLALCQRPKRPTAIELTAYEIDPLFVGYLRETLQHCRVACEEIGISFKWRLVTDDFLVVGASTVAGDLFTRGERERFDCAILNPPYRKIRTKSRERALLRSIGIETTNLYTGFLAVASRLLAPHGEMVAITPRSFCNGPYFEPFRRFFLREMRFRRVHVFDTRDSVFAHDKVLQENVVFHAVRTQDIGPVVVSASAGPGKVGLRMRKVSHDELVRPTDRHVFIHIVPEEDGDLIRDQIKTLGGNLADLGLTVSTGRVVDFRARELLRSQPGRNTVPLIYPCHLRQGSVEWPNGTTRKSNALALGPRSQKLVVPAGHYVLTKRFTAKEERRRIVAAIYDPGRVSSAQVAFENHLNYFHAQGGGLPIALARGLAAYLNSSVVDTYFRQFSGHTQVNASDLRSLPYPPRSTLMALGRRIGKSFTDQVALDHLVEEELFSG